MRPIDADALVSQLRDKADELIPLEEGSRGNTSIFYTGVKVGLQNAAIVADDFPTIEPKHGKWVERGENDDGTHNIQCSACEAGYKSKGHANSIYTKQRFHFCPNCGADMRERSEE